jgi:hypothetical protein
MWMGDQERDHYEVITRRFEITPLPKALTNRLGLSRRFNLS